MMEPQYQCEFYGHPPHAQILCQKIMNLYNVCPDLGRGKHLEGMDLEVCCYDANYLVLVQQKDFSS